MVKEGGKEGRRKGRKGGRKEERKGGRKTGREGGRGRQCLLQTRGVIQIESIIPDKTQAHFIQAKEKESVSIRSLELLSQPITGCTYAT